MRPVVNLIMPRCCGVCGRELSRGQRYACTSCRLDVPMTGFWFERENPMTDRIKALRPEIEHVSAMIFYIDGSLWRDMIHRFKYQQEWRHGVDMGRWFGGELRRSKIYDDVDCVVAVPLHPFRRMSRGYNQAEYIAYGLSRSLGVECLRGAVIRHRNNAPQARHSRGERWRNVENIFSVVRGDRLKGRNILLVDDVFTTGATTLSCAEAILDAEPDCRVWIVALAVSNREFGLG